jgi:hypothetical protein
VLSTGALQDASHISSTSGASSWLLTSQNFEMD